MGTRKSSFSMSIREKCTCPSTWHNALPNEPTFKSAGGDERCRRGDLGGQELAPVDQTRRCVETLNRIFTYIYIYII